MTGSKRNFLHGVSITLAGSLFVGLGGYFSRRLMVTFLPDNEYAFFYSAYSFLSIAGVLISCGMGSAAFFLIPEFVNKKRNDAAAKTSAALFRFLIPAGLAAAALLYIGVFTPPGKVVCEYFHIPENFLYYTPVLLFPTMLLPLIFSVLNAKKSFALANLLQMVNIGLIVVLLWIGLPKWGFPAAAAAYSAGFLVVFAAGLMLLQRCFGFSIFLRPEKDITKKLFRSGLWLLITNLSYSFFMDLGSVMLAFVSTPEEIAVFNIALPIAMLVRSFVVLTTVFSPFSNDLYHQGNQKILMRAIHLLLLSTPVLMIGAGVFFALFGKWVIALLFGAAHENANNCTLILVVGMLLWNGAQLLSDTLSSLQEYRKNSFITLGIVLIMPVLYCFFGKAFGAEGCAGAIGAGSLLWLTMNYLFLRGKLSRRESEIHGETAE